MKRTGFAIIVGLIMVFATATSVWAAEEPETRAVLLVEEDGNGSSSFAPPVDEGFDGYGGDEALKKRHRQIDDILFKQNKGDFAEQGFRVSHTGPSGAEDVIEVGIVPYEKAHADVVLEMIGEDMVRVVEGFVAVPLIGMDDGSGSTSISPEIGVAPPADNKEAINAMTVEDDGAAPATDADMLRTTASGSGEKLVHGVSAAETIMPQNQGRSMAEVVGWIAAIAALLLAVTWIVRKPWIRNNKS